MHQTILLLFLLSFSILAGPGTTGAITLVSESFDDHAYSSPLTYRWGPSGYDVGMIYDTANAKGGSGYCLRFDHAQTDSSETAGGVGYLSNFATHVESGIYFRYWIKYASNYQFPWDRGKEYNVKIIKFAGSGTRNMEFAWRDTTYSSPSSPNAMLLSWYGADGIFSTRYNGNNFDPLGSTLTKGVWHKIEIYLKIAAPSTIHVQVDDHDVFKDTNASIMLPGSDYSIGQFMSILAGTAGKPPAGQGYYYTDDITIIAAEGDLCDREPPEPSGAATPEPLPPPAIINIIKNP